MKDVTKNVVSVVVAQPTREDVIIVSDTLRGLIKKEG